jgi:hypothetical protein
VIDAVGLDMEQYVDLAAQGLVTLDLGDGLQHGGDLQACDPLRHSSR